MRSLGILLAAAAVAATLSGCGKSPAQAPAPEPTGTTEAPAPVAAPAGPTEAETKALLAALPAPYNTADLSNGQSKFALCSTCHTLVEGGPNMTGPNLYGIVGRKAGTAANFTYSDPMKAAGFTWDVAKIDTWITDPKTMMPGTKMTFAGMKDPKDRTDVIAYVLTHTGYKAK